MSIEQQVEILNKITQIMSDSAQGQYDEMRCEFEHEVDGCSWSVGSKFSFVRDGALISEFLDDPNDETSNFVHQLYCLMKEHTGGNWKSFVLSVEPSGKANTKFTY